MACPRLSADPEEIIQQLTNGELSVEDETEAESQAGVPCADGPVQVCEHSSNVTVFSTQWHMKVECYALVWEAM